MIFELFEISSNIIFYFCLLYIWIYFIVAVMGETGVDVVLILSLSGMVLSAPSYIFEYLFTGTNFQNSICGTVFLISFGLFGLFVISGFLMYPMFKSQQSLLENLLKKYHLDS